MPDLHIDLTIPQSELFYGFFVLVFALLIVMSMTTHEKRLRSFFFNKEFLYFVLAVIFLPLAVLAAFEVYVLVLAGPQSDVRGYAILLSAIIGAPFIIWRTWIAQKTGEVTAQGHMTDRISKAVEQLGAEKTVWKDNKQWSEPNLEVRIGAIYQLERIAQDSMRDHISVMEVLCAYVRSNASKADDSYTKTYSSPREDIKSALTVIGRRSEQQIEFERTILRNKLKTEFRLDLSKVHICGADLQNMNFENAKFSYSDISRSLVRRSSFRGALLFKTNFKNSYFSAADFELALVFEANFTNADELTSEQIGHMFGNKTTILPKTISNPNWSDWEASAEESNENWKAAKKEAGLP
ncbi:MAG: pentapeptide repeat-containing protein [Rhodobacteraceae bacterium]|nr:pentapeptide repeat-containing protein [Paracoccaceae bacterium]